jgi:hypothetical protein
MFIPNSVGMLYSSSVLSLRLSLNLWTADILFDCTLHFFIHYFANAEDLVSWSIGSKLNHVMVLGRTKSHAGARLVNCFIYAAGICMNVNLWLTSSWCMSVCLSLSFQRDPFQPISCVLHLSPFSLLTPCSWTCGSGNGLSSLPFAGCRL